jgi:hypothetical protein
VQNWIVNCILSQILNNMSLWYKAKGLSKQIDLRCFSGGERCFIISEDV